MDSIFETVIQCENCKCTETTEDRYRHPDECFEGWLQVQTAKHGSPDTPKIRFYCPDCRSERGGS
jgi:hypothetical protein